MIDIYKDSPKTQSSPKVIQKKPNWSAIVLGICLSFVVYDTSYWKKFTPDKIVPSEKYTQVLFVTDENMSAGQGQASISFKVDKFCEENNIERRRLEKNQDVSNAENWLQEMSEIGYGQAPSIVFRSSSGKLDCIPIPETIEETISEIRRRI